MHKVGVTAVTQHLCEVCRERKLEFAIFQPNIADIATMPNREHAFSSETKRSITHIALTVYFIT